MTWLLAAVCGVASVPAGIRWLRVSQREHYLAPAATRFAWRWWTARPVNVALLVAGVGGVIGVLWDARLGFVLAAAQVGPVGLSVRGVTSPLAWTERLRRLAVASGLIVAAVYLVGGLLRSPLIVVLGLILLPLIVDLAAAVLAPLEKALGNRWVKRAAAKLKSVDCDVVAITGSYGKTSTKNYLAHLLADHRRTVASPASFNNRMGLARAINEGLGPDTEVFIAEMGTYGMGEIAEMTSWVTPKISAMIAIGPVHLERFGSEERIVEAKSEILDRADIGVVCIDHPLLAKLAEDRSDTMKIVEVSAANRVVRVDGREVMTVPESVFPSNLAVATGIALELGVPLEVIKSKLATLPVAEHRQTVLKGEAGFTIIDDTFNSNPAGARRALELLAASGDGRKVVVTPGMIELGPQQARANAEFATSAAATADDVIIVGRTNRRALLQGASAGRAAVTVVDSRDEAVAWVRNRLGPSDAVLYENDLPDHYP